MKFSRAAIAATSTAALLVLAACSGGTDTGSSTDHNMADMGTTTSMTASTTEASPTGSSPASPTELVVPPSLSTIAPRTPATGSTTSDSAQFNDADLMFAQMMIVHHQGAIEMAELVPDRAASTDVKDLGEQIKQAQAPEIELMNTWIQSWTGQAPTTDDDMGGMGGMDHGNMGGSDDSTGMPGMMTPEQMTALTDATGPEFDTLFLELMIEHHQGAITMAETEIASGINPDALALAAQIVTDQTAEIAVMQKLLQSS